MWYGVDISPHSQSRGMEVSSLPPISCAVTFYSEQHSATKMSMALLWWRGLIVKTVFVGVGKAECPGRVVLVASVMRWQVVDVDIHELMGESVRGILPRLLSLIHI